MKWKFITVPLATATGGTGALMLVLYVLGKRWNGGEVSPWLENVVKWDVKFLLAPLKMVYEAFPALHRHAYPLVTTFVLYGLIGLALVSIWEGNRRLIRMNRKTKPEGSC